MDQIEGILQDFTLCSGWWCFPFLILLHLILLHTYNFIIAFIAFGLITAVVRPYKVTFFTYVDVFFFNILAIIMALQLLVIYYRAIEFDFLLVPAGSLIYSLIMIPFVYSGLYALYWIAGRAPLKFKRRFLRFMRYMRGHSSQICQKILLITIPHLKICLVVSLIVWNIHLVTNPQ